MVTNPNVPLSQTSLNYPSGTNLTPIGGSASSPGNGIANRNLSFTINNETEGTYYFSFLIQRSAPPNITSGVFVSGLQLQPHPGNGLARIDLGIGSDGFLRACIDGQPCNKPNYAIEEGVTYFVVARLDTAAGEDRLRVAFFNPSQQVPNSEPVWEIDRMLTLAESISTIAIRGGGSTAWDVDEIRITTTYAEATGAIPEPASLALVTGSALLILRRRSR